jgi:ubiquinone/menaquinone biosynthesis C-methylase UbiE
LALASWERIVTKYDAREIRALYDRGENVTRWIQAHEEADNNSVTAILYSYDAQAGSYVDALKEPAARALKQDLGRELGAILDKLGPGSLLEAGIGEGTSLVPVLNQMGKRPDHILGFDLSLSRLLFARRHLTENGYENVKLFTGDLDRIPLASESVDVVLTVHAVEPNQGREEHILSELLRVARKHLVMIEPSYELASAEARARMDRLGYVRGLPKTLIRLGHPARLIERWRHNSNPLNEATLVVVDKAPTDTRIDPRFVSPISGCDLIERKDCWHCPEDGHAFPIIAGIPCLTVENAILASKLDRF